jgi:hypothetical protein
MPTTPDRQQAWLELTRQRATSLAAMGIPFVFVLAPDKHSVYRHVLPEAYQYRQAYYLTQLECVLDIAPTLRAIAPVVDVYPRTDSHWNQIGAHIAAGAVIAKLNVRAPDNFITWRMDTLPGDLGGKLSPLETSERPVAVFKDPSQLIYDNGVPNNGRIRIFSRLQDCRLNDGNLCLIFGDSFSYDMVHSLKESFDVVVQVHSFALDFELIRKLQPNYVIAEMTERFASRLPTPGDGHPLPALWLDKIFRRETALLINGVKSPDARLHAPSAMNCILEIEELYRPYRRFLGPTTVDNPLPSEFSPLDFPLKVILSDPAIAGSPDVVRFILKGFSATMSSSEKAEFLSEFATPSN